LSDTAESLPVPISGSTVDEKKPIEFPKNKQSSEDKLSALKSYRRSKGLCFKCGEKWGPHHKCPTTVSLAAIEEIWKYVEDGYEIAISHEEESFDSGEDLMAIFVQDMNGTEGSRIVRLRGYIQWKEVFMLIDSRSSHSFLSDLVAATISPWHSLAQSVSVKVANGQTLACTHGLLNQIWGTQGITFCSTMKIIPLRGYDVILGMDWLESHSPMMIH
jgi:hypothetical protein